MVSQLRGGPSTKVSRVLTLPSFVELQLFPRDLASLRDLAPLRDLAFLGVYAWLRQWGFAFVLLDIWAYVLRVWVRITLVHYLWFLSWVLQWRSSCVIGLLAIPVNGFQLFWASLTRLRVVLSPHWILRPERITSRDTDRRFHGTLVGFILKESTGIRRANNLG